MKVLHITDDLTSTSGVRSYVMNIGKLMEPAGVRSRQWAPEPAGDFASDHLSRWASRRYARELERMLAEDRPDIVHAHNVWMRLSPTPLKVARAAGIPVVMTVHDYHLVCPRKWMITGGWGSCERGFGWRCLLGGCRGAREGWRWLPYNDLRWLKVAAHRRMLRAWVDLFLCPSEHLASWLCRNLGVRDVVHIPNFTETVDDSAIPNRRDAVLLYVGRLSREKGVDVLIRAMSVILEVVPDARLRVVGAGPQQEALHRLAAEVGVERAVEFLGGQPPGRLDEMYQGCGVFVLPTLWMENCPVAVLEAMARGRPVVASSIGGVPELVEHGVTGLLVKGGDPEVLAREIVRLLENPDLRVRMGRAALAAHAGRYTPEAHARRLSRQYHRALARKGVVGAGASAFEEP